MREPSRWRGTREWQPRGSSAEPNGVDTGLATTDEGVMSSVISSHVAGAEHGASNVSTDLRSNPETGSNM